jgi:hypothetical protein
MSIFAAWLANFAVVATASPATYGFSAGDVTAIGNANTAFQNAYAVSSAPETRTSPTIAATNTARANAEYVVRPFAVAVSLSRSITDEQKSTLGVTIRSAIPTPVPAPVDAPTNAIVRAIPGQVTLQTRVPGSSGKAKPAGCIGVEVWKVAGVAPAVDPASTTFAFMATKSPFNLTITEGEKGKTVTIFTRYTTRSGPGGVAQTGPWSAPLTFAGM